MLGTYIPADASPWAVLALLDACGAGNTWQGHTPHLPLESCVTHTHTPRITHPVLLTPHVTHTVSHPPCHTHTPCHSYTLCHTARVTHIPHVTHTVSHPPCVTPTPHVTPTPCVTHPMSHTQCHTHLHVSHTSHHTHPHWPGHHLTVSGTAFVVCMCSKEVCDILLSVKLT